MSEPQAFRILVVDDEPMIAEMIVEMLTDANYAVVGPYLHLGEALRAAEAEICDAAVLDMNLAGRTSQPIAEALTRRNVPFVFLTGYGKAGHPSGYAKAPVVAKPFEPDDLFLALTQAMGSSPPIN